MVDAISNPDQFYTCGHSRAEMATAGESRWGIAPSYFIESYPAGRLSKATWDRIVDEAFAHVQETCGIGYSKASSAESANIVWGTVRGRRAGGDGPMGTLAFMYMFQGRSFRGQTRGYWDGDEPWNYDPTGKPVEGIDAFAVTLHELGHGEGMLHTNVPNQLLNATYNKRIRTFQENDKKVLVGKYGPSVIVPAPLPPVNPNQPALPPTPGRAIEVKVLDQSGAVWYGKLTPLPAAQAANLEF